MSPSREPSSKPTDPSQKDSSGVVSSQAATSKGQKSDAAQDKALLSPPRRPAPPPPAEPTPPAEAEVVIPEASVEPDTVPSSQQPIPPPSEPMQYRAIGLVRGIYQPSEEQLNRGTLTTEDGTELDAVLLGQVMSLVKKYLDLEKPYLWVVYPRTRDKQETLHVQIVGVWSEEGFGDENEDDADAEATQPSGGLSAPLQDGYFSIRGQVVFQSADKEFVLVKIQQAPRKGSDRSKDFKLKLLGKLEGSAIGYFWDLQVLRLGNALAITSATSVAMVPLKKRKKTGSPHPHKRSDAPSRGKPVILPKKNKQRTFEPPIKRQARSADSE
ncbi:MAG: hypothetical protein ACFCU8_11315 [Thermosynechococcaceae cyanobacterium]